MRKTKTARDFVAIADAFAREAIADVNRQKHCMWIRYAAARYVRDRRKAATKGGPFKFSHIEAVRSCQFIEQLPHVEGKWKTPTIELHRSHVFFLVNLFGFRNTDGTRRFTTAQANSTSARSRSISPMSCTRNARWPKGRAVP